MSHISVVAYKMVSILYTVVPMTEQIPTDDSDRPHEGRQIMTGPEDHVVEYYGRNESEWGKQHVELHEIPWRHLIQLAKEPKDSDHKEARSVAGVTAENVLRQFSHDTKASGTDLGRLLAANIVASRDSVWEVYYQAEKQGYFHEVGDVAFVSDYPAKSEPPEMDAIEW